MPRISTLEPTQAPPGVLAVYTDFYRRMMFPAAPNFLKVQGHSSTVVQGTWDVVRNVLVTGKISRFVKEMLFVAISNDRGCRYCVAAHIACCRMLGADPQLINSLVHNVGSLTDPPTRDIVLFGLKCSRDPQSLTQADFARLHKHGLGDSEIIEIIAMSGLAVYANIMADATGVEPDHMFNEVG